MAVTRAKRVEVLVGSWRAVAEAVRTVGAGRRHTALARRLRAVPRNLRNGFGRPAWIAQ
jgi:exodeoxyribonuclease V alpha subunit